MFGELPASGMFVRNVRNLEVSNVEIATQRPDARPAFWLENVDGADFSGLKRPAILRCRFFAWRRSKIFGSSAANTWRTRLSHTPTAEIFEWMRNVLRVKEGWFHVRFIGERNYAARVHHQSGFRDWSRPTSPDRF